MILKRTPVKTPAEAAWEKLLASLSETQRQEIRETGAFKVTGSAGNAYTISTHTYSGNVQAFINGYGRVGYCCHLPGGSRVPLGDHLLAQALLIRTNETLFRNTACRC